jgi:hypothetical protein
MPIFQKREEEDSLPAVGISEALLEVDGIDHASLLDQRRHFHNSFQTWTKV